MRMMNVERATVRRIPRRVFKLKSDVRVVMGVEGLRDFDDAKGSELYPSRSDCFSCCDDSVCFVIFNVFEKRVERRILITLRAERVGGWCTLVKKFWSTGSQNDWV